MKLQFCANFNWKLHTFTLFQTCLPCQIKLYFVNIQSNQNLTSWSYSIQTIPNQIRHNPSRTNNIIYRIQIVNSILSVILILSIFSVAWKANTYPSKISVVHCGAQLPQFKQHICRADLQNFQHLLLCTYFWT